MSFKSRGTYGDPLGNTWSIWGGSSEFDSFFDILRGGADILGIPQVLFPMGGSRGNPPPIFPPRAPVSPVVIGEIPGSIQPGVPTGPVVNPVPSGPITVPEGWETVIIGGEERIVVPDEYGGAKQDEILVPVSEAVLRIPVPGSSTRDEDLGDDDVHDWGHLIRQGIGQLTGVGAPAAATGGFVQTPGAGNVLTGPLPGGAVGAAGTVCVSPRYLTYDTKTGQYSIRRRRRRRALCTDKDLACLAQIVAIVGKGQGGNIAVSKALR